MAASFNVHAGHRRMGPAPRRAGHLPGHRRRRPRPPGVLAPRRRDQPGPGGRRRPRLRGDRGDAGRRAPGRPARRADGALDAPARLADHQPRHLPRQRAALPAAHGALGPLPGRRAGPLGRGGAEPPAGALDRGHRAPPAAPRPGQPGRGRAERRGGRAAGRRRRHPHVAPLARLGAALPGRRPDARRRCSATSRCSWPAT